MQPFGEAASIRGRVVGRAWGHGDGGEGEAWSQWRLVDRMADSQDTTPRPSEGGPSVRYPRASGQPRGASEEERRILSVPRMVPDERALERVGNRRGFGGCGRATPQGETVRLKTIVRTYSLAGASDPAFSRRVKTSEITLV